MKERPFAAAQGRMARWAQLTLCNRCATRLPEWVARLCAVTASQSLEDSSGDGAGDHRYQIFRALSPGAKAMEAGRAGRHQRSAALGAVLGDPRIGDGPRALGPRRRQQATSATALALGALAQEAFRSDPGEPREDGAGLV